MSLPSEAPLTPKAFGRVMREVTVQSYSSAARALSEDWGCNFDRRQLQRWATRAGERLVQERASEAAASESGRRPRGPSNPPRLLVIEMDGGRVQFRERNEQTGSRWREDKVATITSYLPGNGELEKPKPLTTTHVATMGESETFGRLVRLEAERRGLYEAVQVLLLGDGGNWIDPLCMREFPGLPRVIDWYHAVEHLYACGRAVHGSESPLAEVLAKEWESHLWRGEVERVVSSLRFYSARLGAPESGDGAEHPRRVLYNNAAYFERHREQMRYGEYRRRGWPIGSGGVEAGVKQFNKRVKGTEQFWEAEGVEAVLALRGLWLSQDDRWARYWAERPAYKAA